MLKYLGDFKKTMYVTLIGKRKGLIDSEDSESGNSFYLIVYLYGQGFYFVVYFVLMWCLELI